MVAATLAFVAVWCGARRVPGVAGFRPASLGRGSAARAPWAERVWVRAIACTGGAAAVGLLVLGLGGGVLGAVLGTGVAWWLGTVEPAAVARDRELIARDLPAAAELLAACTMVGAPVDRAVAIVADALEGPLARRLRAVLLRLELGADPTTVWRQLALDEPALATLARAVVRSLESGAAPADALIRLAADRRRDRTAVLQARARAVGVKSAGPLAACFLPAFMLIGVVPIVAGVFRQIGL